MAVVVWEELPNELWFQIMVYVDTEDLASLSCVNWKLRIVSCDARLWKNTFIHYAMPLMKAVAVFRHPSSKYIKNLSLNDNGEQRSCCTLAQYICLQDFNNWCARDFDCEVWRYSHSNGCDNMFKTLGSLQSISIRSMAPAVPVHTEGYGRAWPISLRKVEMLCVPDLVDKDMVQVLLDTMPNLTTVHGAINLSLKKMVTQKNINYFCNPTLCLFKH